MCIRDRFKPNYMIIDGLRIHYLDEGPKDADPIFLLHGEPTWSYLFRKMIPILVNEGHRVIVPDCVGFGKSDKFISKYDYSYKHHVEVMIELIERLDLKNTTFFGQDWGGLVGLRVVAEIPDRFGSVVVSNTGFAAAEGLRAWFVENLTKLVVWWNGPVTFEELSAAAEKALSEGEPSASTGMSMFAKWMAYSYNADNMNIVGIIEKFGGQKINNIDDGLKICDYVSLHVPLNEKTKNLIDYSRLKNMKREAIVINTARGGIINEKDLDKALRENIIFGAGLDVFENEPIDKTNPLLSNKKVLLSPHSATFTNECKSRMSLETTKTVSYTHLTLPTKRIV